MSGEGTGNPVPGLASAPAAPRLVREWEAAFDELPHDVRGDIA